MTMMSPPMTCTSADGRDEKSAGRELPGYTDGADVIQVACTRNQIDVIGGVVYAQIKKLRAARSLTMTVLVPRTQILKPAIVFFPGGGFLTSDHEKYIEVRMALAAAGFVVAAAEYRTIPDTFPALVEDGKAAVRYLRAHADEYGIDPERIGVIGDSAGGYLAQMLGVTNGDKEFDRGDFLDASSDVQAVVTIYGISNLLNIGEGFSEDVLKEHDSVAAVEALLVHGASIGGSCGAPIASDPQKALHASPMGHLNGRKPPFLILHGSADQLVSPRQSAQLYTGLRAGGNEAEYVLLDGAGHGDLHWFQQAIAERVVNWFKKAFAVAGDVPEVANAGRSL